jgi:hypothetical protein
MTPPDDSKRAEILVEVSRFVNLFLWRGDIEREREREIKRWISGGIGLVH